MNPHGFRGKNGFFLLIGLRPVGRPGCTRITSCLPTKRGRNPAEHLPLSTSYKELTITDAVFLANAIEVSEGLAEPIRGNSAGPATYALLM
jgi:hypothetical protein